MRRVEHPHHDRDQIKGYLDDARAIVTELELDGDLLVPAFVKAVDLLSSKTVNIIDDRPALVRGLELGGIPAG